MRPHCFRTTLISFIRPLLSLFYLVHIISQDLVMIRREPTLIPMTDFDVQQVRDLVAAQKAAKAPPATDEQKKQEPQSPVKEPWPKTMNLGSGLPT
ncbi:hypothetical protein FISHEDRAFT_77670 [Fistulina hepatica ATCC 64428]|uniref:Uncharacterized protein n=1 Tax=Fistulina hepatica ATCC 64428 TaxID=1128425 RepID=A0A0D7A182_9AGAR|nr:hypothetical protein FISHEDRAFT_77670 [Fistulina hepatica ATCC 64428]